MRWFGRYLKKRASEGIMRFRQGRDIPDEMDHMPVIDVIYSEMSTSKNLISLFHDADLAQYHMDCVIYPIEEELTPTHVWILGLIPGSEDKPISFRIPKLTTFGEARQIARDLAQKNTKRLQDATWKITDDEIDSLFNPK